MARDSFTITLLDVSSLSYAERLVATSLQGLVNRPGPRLFLNFGVYDDPEARRTNENFLPDEIWQRKFRPYVGNQDQHNLDYYCSLYNLEIQQAGSLQQAVKAFHGLLQGCVVWDPQMADTANIALMLAGLEDLLVIPPEKIEWVKSLGLQVKHDLRGRWQERVELYRWAFQELYPRCKPGLIACVEPGWHRPEFTDYLVQNQIFTYSLTSAEKNRLATLGQTLLLLLVGGPFGLRNFLTT